MDALELDQIVDETNRLMVRSIESLKGDIARLSTSRVSVDMISGILVDYYAREVPIGQIATVSAQSIGSINVQPWEISTLKSIEKGINNALLGLKFTNDGRTIRIEVPSLTEERRREIEKIMKRYGENTKSFVKKTYQGAINSISEAIEDGLSQDIAHEKETKIQGLFNKYNEQIELIIEAKLKTLVKV